MTKILTLPSHRSSIFSVLNEKARVTGLIRLMDQLRTKTVVCSGTDLEVRTMVEF